MNTDYELTTANWLGTAKDANHAKKRGDDPQITLIMSLRAKRGNPLPQILQLTTDYRLPTTAFFTTGN
jgi:hypothetical protein